MCCDKNWCMYIHASSEKKEGRNKKNSIYIVKHQYLTEHSIKNDFFLKFTNLCS